MSGEPGPSSSKKPFWEQQAELESQEDPEFIPPDDEMEDDEDTSSSDGIELANVCSKTMPSRRERHQWRHHHPIRE